MEAPVSHFDTVCRTTFNLIASSCCESPFAFLIVLIFSLSTRNTSSYYKVVVFIVPLQGLYAILLEILWIGSHFLPLDGLRKDTTTVSLYSC